MLVKHWLPLVKPDLNPYFRRGTLARAGGGVWLISHSCYRNINKMVNKIFSQMVGLMVPYHGTKEKKSQLKHKSQLTIPKKVTASLPLKMGGKSKLGISKLPVGPAPILGGALSKVFSSRRPEPAGPPWWSRGGSVGHWVVWTWWPPWWLVVVSLDGWIFFSWKFGFVWILVGCLDSFGFWLDVWIRLDFGWMFGFVWILVGCLDSFDVFGFLQFFFQLEVRESCKKRF